MAIERLEDIKPNEDRELAMLLQDLVRIPSYENENAVVDYLESWIKKNTNFDVSRQALAGGRFNLIAAKGNPDLIFLAHTDTVAPNQNAQFDQLAAEIHDGRIWGRGTSDMKSGIATMLQAMQLNPDAHNMWAFFYADEEYDFLGMKAMVEDYADLRPKLIVSSDGSDLAFGHGCRGLFEFRARIIGETSHPAKGVGLNSVLKGFESIFELRDYLSKFVHPKMGGTTINISPVLGGQMSTAIIEEGKIVKIDGAANVVPDVMEFKVDIRPGTTDLNIDMAIENLKQNAEAKALKFELLEKVHEYGAWYTEVQDIEEFAEIAKEVTGDTQVTLQNPGETGYIDLQMFWDKVGRPPAFMFGSGEGSTAHTPQENIKIGKLIKGRDFFAKVLEKHGNQI